MKVSNTEVSFEGTLVIKKVGDMFSVHFFVDEDRTGPFALGNFASVPEQVVKEFELK